MRLAEALLVVIALSFNVFLVAEYEGSNLKILNLKKLMIICGTFFLLQMVAMGAGYLITQIPFFRRAISDDLKALCYVLSAIIFLILGCYMLYRTIRRETLEEKLMEFLFRRIFLEAMTVAVFTFACGIGCGFIGTSVLSTFITVACATILSVILGLYTGYYQGYRFRAVGYGVSCAIFIFAGVEVLIRYL